MNVEKFNLNNIGNIKKLPNQVVGDAANLKLAFDKNAEAIAEYINDTLVPEVNKKLTSEDGMGLSSNVYTTEEKTKLSNLPDAEMLSREFAKKVDAEVGKGLSSNDFTQAYIDEIGRMPKKISNLTDDTKANPIEKATIAEFDSDGNHIASTYAEKTKLAEVEAIARGKSVAHVFNTENDMRAWIDEHKSSLTKGENFYIRATDQPDYWWDGTDALPLETEKVDLSNVAIVYETPISKLVDDTDDQSPINYARMADWSSKSDIADTATHDVLGRAIHETYLEVNDAGVINLGKINGLSDLDKCNKAGVYVFKINSFYESSIDGSTSDQWETGILIVRTQDNRYFVESPDGSSGLTSVRSEGQQCILECDYGYGLRVLWREWNDNLPLEGRPWVELTPLSENFVTKQELNSAIGEALEDEY